jgi:hypothetical protein
MVVIVFYNYPNMERSRWQIEIIQILSDKLQQYKHLRWNHRTYTIDPCIQNYLISVQRMQNDKLHYISYRKRMILYGRKMNRMISCLASISRAHTILIMTARG